VIELRVIPIVEGHGEVQSMRVLIQRIGLELFNQTYIEVLRPIRQPRSRLVQSAYLTKALQLARGKLRAEGNVDSRNALILVLFDANGDCPAELAASALATANDVVDDSDVAVVLAKVEYETWFVAAADSLREHLRIDGEQSPPSAPEEARAGKGWITQRYRGIRYSETQDQPAMTSSMDLELCRRRSPSFNKLCREIGRRVVTEP